MESVGWHPLEKVTLRAEMPRTDRFSLAAPIGRVEAELSQDHEKAFARGWSARKVTEVSTVYSIMCCSHSPRLKVTTRGTAPTVSQSRFMTFPTCLSHSSRP